jgi:hypothetical protein
MSRRKCPRPKKRAYPTRGQALASIGPQMGLRWPVTAYHCRCGSWHLAHSTHYGRRP